MTLEVTTPASSRVLVDSQRIARILGITDDSKLPLIRELADMASGMVEEYCNRVFAKQTYREKRGGSGEPFLVLQRAPVISLSAVTYDGQDYSADTYIHDSKAGLLYRPEGFISTETYYVELLYEPYGPGRQLWQFDYDAGFTLPSETTEYTLPRDVVLAVSRIVGWLLQEEKGFNPAVESMKFGDSSVTFKNDPRSGLPAPIASLLKPWRLTF